MENLDSYLPMVKEAGVIRSCIKKDLAIPMVATRDIGWKAADFLDSTAPFGRLIFEFVGPKEVSMNHVGEVFGNVFELPDLWYQEISYEEAKKAMLASGMSNDFADLMIEMYQAFNFGLIVPTQEIKPSHRGMTTLDEYVQMITHKLLAYAR